MNMNKTLHKLILYSSQESVWVKTPKTNGQLKPSQLLVMATIEKVF